MTDLTHEQLAALLNTAARNASTTLTGAILRRSGGRVTVTLDSPYRGTTVLDAQAGAGCSSPGRVSCFFVKGQGWVAIGQGQQQQSRTVVRARRGRANGKQKQFELKAGYCYRKTISAQTAIVCGTDTPPAPPGQPSYPLPKYFPGNYNPVPPGGGSRRIRITQVASAYNVSYHVEGCGDNYSGAYNTPAFTQVFNFTLNPSSVLTYTTDSSGSFFVPIDGSIVSTLLRLNGSILLGVYGAKSADGSRFDEEGQCTRHYTESGSFFANVTIEDLDGLPLNAPPPEDPVPGDPLPPPPPATTSYEFYYVGTDATVPVKVKTLATDQPLEAKPFILHSDSDTSYVVLKYGSAGNDGGSSDDWCKTSIFTVSGTDTLASTETVYPWTAASEVIAALQAVDSPFAATIGSKTKLENLNLAALVTSGDLDERWRCLTHRNTIGLHEPDVGETDTDPFVYLLDPATSADTALATLAGDTYYDVAAIKTTLVTGASISVVPRKFLIEQNPSFNSGIAENCATNPAYTLQDADDPLDAVTLPGLSSSDSSIVVLTVGTGWVES